jgi:hypothetical protein
LLSTLLSCAIRYEPLVPFRVAVTIVAGFDDSRGFLGLAVNSLYDPPESGATTTM